LENQGEEKITSSVPIFLYTWKTTRKRSQVPDKILA
jgi:hypothetical protein